MTFTSVQTQYQRLSGSIVSINKTCCNIRSKASSVARTGVQTYAQRKWVLALQSNMRDTHSLRSLHLWEDPTPLCGLKQSVSCTVCERLGSVSQTKSQS